MRRDIPDTSIQDRALIHWPAIIQYAGQAELAYVPDQAAWENNAYLHPHAWQATDRLIDSQGAIHAFIPAGKIAELQSTGNAMSRDELLHLVRTHAAQAGLCCIAKLSAPTIAEAIKLVGSLHED